MARKKQSEKLDPLEEIKRLLILGLVHSGVQASVIADFLGITKGTLSKIAPVRKIKKQN